MSLKTRIREDNHRVFMNMTHFADTHNWNGTEFICVTDEEHALKRKNNNVVDLSWDNNSRDVTVFVPSEDFPGRAMPNECGYFDNKPMKIMQVSEDNDMLTIVMANFDPKAVAGY